MRKIIGIFAAAISIILFSILILSMAWSMFSFHVEVTTLRLIAQINVLFCFLAAWGLWEL